MTCIVGVEYNNEVFLCGDRAASTIDVITVNRAPKVYKKFTKKKQTPVVIGWAGAFLFGNVLQYKYIPPDIKPGMTPDEYVYHALIKDLRKCMTDNHYQPADDPGYTMIGVNGRLFTLQEDFSMLHNEIGYGAIGSGAMIAMGAMQVMWNGGQIEPKSFLIKAAEASAAFSTTVRGPFDIVSTEIDVDCAKTEDGGNSDGN